MQALARLCVRRPVFASVLILALVVVGGVGYTRLGVDRYPNVDFPTVAVITRLAGAAPEEVETEITDKIEESINTIAGIDELQSDLGRGHLAGLRHVHPREERRRRRAGSARQGQPRARRPAARTSTSRSSRSSIRTRRRSSPSRSRASRTLRETTEFADKVLRRQLESINGVGQVTILGGRSRRINVRLDTDAPEGLRPDGRRRPARAPDAERARSRAAR